MRVISKRPLREFWQRHPEARPMLNEWFRKASQVTAISFPALRETFGSADYVDGLHYSMWVGTGIVLQQSFITTSNGCIFVK